MHVDMSTVKYSVALYMLRDMVGKLFMSEVTPKLKEKVNYCLCVITLHTHVQAGVM